MGPLWHATRDLHHAAERHPVGAAMADGSISERWWCDWLGALRVVHAALDPHLPAALHRVHQIDADLAVMAPMQPAVGHAPHLFAGSLTTHLAITGAAYVFTGAHLFGGALTARALGGRLPASHLLWVDRQDALRIWRPMRDAIEAELYACSAFSAVLAIMDGIAGYD